MIYVLDYIIFNFKYVGDKPSALRKRKRKLGEQIEEAMKNGRYLMGNATLTKLWNVCPDNFEAAAGKYL